MYKVILMLSLILLPFGALANPVQTPHSPPRVEKRKQVVKKLESLEGKELRTIRAGETPTDVNDTYLTVAGGVIAGAIILAY